MKNFFLFAACLIILTLTGCQPILNHGVYSANPDSDSLTKVTINRFIITETIDNAELGWENDMNSTDVVQLDSGIHSFGLLYHDNQGLYTQKAQKVYALFEAGRSYKVVPVVAFMEVHFDIIDEETQQSVTVDVSSLSGSNAAADFMADYVTSVQTPVMADEGKTIIEEGDDFILYNEPDMRFTLIDKKTGETRTGHRMFTANFTFTSGTVYLKFDDGTVTKDEFLESNYQEDADIIMIVTDCDKKNVTYTYVKPDDLKGKVIKLTITQA